MPECRPWILSETLTLPGGNVITSEHKFKSTADVARYIGCSVWTIYRWEKGTTNYPLLSRYRLRDARLETDNQTSAAA